MEVRVLIPAQVLPGLAAVVRAEDAARADVVAEDAGREHDVRVRWIGLDDVVVEALPVAVVEDAFRACASRQDVPARAFIIRPPHAGLFVRVAVVVLETEVQDRVVSHRMRQADREAGRRDGVVAGRQAIHDRVPGLAGIGALVDLVAPEACVQDARVLRIHLEIGGAIRLADLAEQCPGLGAVLRLPDAVLGMDRRRHAASTAAAAQDGGIQVIGIGRVDHDPRHRDGLEVVTGHVRPVLAAVVGSQHAVAEVRVAQKRALAGARIDDRVVRGSNRQGADRQAGLVIRLRLPQAAGRVELPDSALGRSQDILAGAGTNRQRADTA